MGFFAALIDSIRKPASLGLLDEEPQRRTPIARALCSHDFLRPQGHALALEPRVMFDGAAASATDQQQGDSTRPPEAPTAERSAIEAPRSEAAAGANAQGSPAAAAASTLPPQHLLVVDSRVEQRELLSAQASPGVTVLVVDSNEDGLAAISAELARLGQVDSIQILSHGAAGQFTLGSRNISSDNVDQLASQLQGWQSSLTQDADIQLCGCNVGAGVSGQTLVNELARWTGADVGASIDATGASADGGNWTLETTVGEVDKALALGEGTLAAFDGLLADASPTVTLDVGGEEVLLGGTFNFIASFTNPSTQVGFAPYIDLFIPATGKDGAGTEADDGVTFVSATFLGENIKSFTLTFDANGQATHPLAKDINGNPLIINAADYGMRAGDQFVVLQLPNASIAQGQPAIDIVVTLRLSNLADTSLSDAAPDLTIKARGGFQFGNTSADDPTLDPSLVEAGTHNFVVHPTMVKLTQDVVVPDGSTPTGPNYSRTIIVTAETASDQTLNNVAITQTLPPEILVTAITPAAGGVLGSITLHSGQVLTVPADIQAAFARGEYIDSYTVTYATLQGSADTVITFYVPEVDADGNTVLDPVTGAPVGITIAAPTATAQWAPLDTRDTPPPGTVLTGTGNTDSFQALSIGVYKQVSVTTDVGTIGATPGDTLTYSMQIQISDYFAFGRNILENGSLVITDTVSDGQTFIDGSGTMTLTVDGSTITIALVATKVQNPDGSTPLTLDLAQSIRNAGRALGAMVGDLAFDAVLQGATLATVSYRTQVGQNYSSPYPQPPINEGDTIGNNATVSGTVLQDQVNLGGTASDSDSTVTQIPASRVDIVILTVNGLPPPANVELRPGDVVTFGLSYNLLTDDYQNFILTAYMPLPLFDLTGVTWSQGSGVNQWSLGTGNTNLDGVDSVTNGPGNSIVFNYGSFGNPLTVTGARIELQFTMTVGNTPFGDNRQVTVLAQSDQLTTVDQQHIVSTDAVVIESVAEPVLSITHGVVSTNGSGAITGTIGTWQPPGNTGLPFTGPLTDPKAVDGSITGMDGGDLLRLATAIENTGGGGAFDVETTVTLPTGLSFVGGSLASTLRIYRGDGTLLVAGTDYTVDNATNTVTFIDGPATAALLPGRDGTAEDASGRNLVILIYDVQVSDTVGASSTLQSSAAVTKYAAANGGPDFLPADIANTAGQQVAAPSVAIVFADGSLSDDDSSASHTTGADLVVGESMLYDIVVTLPEGSAQNLRIDDLIPAGMRLDLSFNGGVGYEIITTAAGSGALSADFNGTLSAGSPSGIGGTVGDDDVNARLTFTASSNAADNNTGNNSFVIRVRLVASNTTDNQAGRALASNAQLTYSDPDGNVAGGAAVDRTVGNSGAQPTANLREPTLTITQTTSAIPRSGVDSGDLITYTITISNASGFDAFDINFNDAFPTLLLNGLTYGGAVYAGNATNNGGPDFELMGGVLRSAAGANIDVRNGGSIVLTVTGTVAVTAENAPSINNTAVVNWTSLDGTDNTAQAGERTGVDGPLNGGTLNDYQASATTNITVLNGIEMSRVGGLVDTPISPTGTDGPAETVAVGELVRYRVVSAVGEGATLDYRIQVTLDQGLEFLDDGTVRIVFITSSGENIALLAEPTDDPGNLQVAGSRDSLVAQPIASDLSGPGPISTLLSSRITVATATDGSGRTIVTFDLGTVDNLERDADLEGVAIEFTARVANVATNVAGAQLGATAAHLVGDGGSGTLVRSTGETLLENVVEPTFNNVVKQVDSFTPNASGTTSSANVSVSFTQSGNTPAYDVRLVDSFAGVGSYTPTSISINGTSHAIGALPAGVAFTSSAAGIVVTFDRLDAGAAVVVHYSVDVANNTAYASTDAVLTWSSLPEGFTTWGGSNIGADGLPEGERDGRGTAPNNYVRSEGAGLGLVSGTLWDDTLSATADATTPDGTRLANQTVTLTWAGADGAFGNGDDQVFTTVTDSNGFFHFSALAAGSYRVDAPTPITLAQPTGELRVRIDSDGATLGQVLAPVGEGGIAVANAGYVQLNDAPVNTLPAALSGSEDVLLPVTGISIADVDANNSGTDGIVDVVLGVSHGVLNLSAAPPANVTVTGQGTGSMIVTGTLADLNAALATLTYLGNLNFNGSDTLIVTSRDHGNFGDFDGNGTPGQSTDQRTDTNTLLITLAAVNDAPQGVNDAALATEAGGSLNGTPGVNPTGNMLDNDIDVDVQTNADSLHLVSVTSVETSNSQSPTGINEFEVVGRYGSLFVTANGGYRYVVDNADPLVQALRLSGQTLTEVFNYTLADSANEPATGATPALTITIQGANDTPAAADDTGTATEAGGVNNGTAGADATGNVLGNDGDVDTVANGETRTVTGIRAVREAAPGGLTSVTAAGVSIAGKYGTLTINAQGVYTYVVDNTNAAVQALQVGETLADEYFSYQVTDAGGLNDLAELLIVVQGANDAPVADDDVGNAFEAGGVNNGTPGTDPTGNVLANDTDVDDDQVLLTVTAIRTGPLDLPGTNGTLGVELRGSYGWLTLNADGSYSYRLDNDMAEVQALRQFTDVPLFDFFTYTVGDAAGQTDLAVLNIVIRGANDTPVAQNDTATAIEAGGFDNGTAGVNPSGNVILENDSDVDRNGEVLSIAGFEQAGTAGTLGTAFTAQYGSLLLNADGSYTYTVDNGNGAVQALRVPTDTLLEVFTYTLTDALGATTTATLTVTIRGSNDTPVATNDIVLPREAGGTLNNTPGLDPSGNLLINDSDVDGSESRVLVGIRTGAEDANTTFVSVQGVRVIDGLFGTLTVSADGSYTYVLHNTAELVERMRAGDSLTENFTYQTVDRLGATDTAQITVTIAGAWDAPVAHNDVDVALPALVRDPTVGRDAVGNVLTNDTDVDIPDGKTATGIRLGREADGTPLTNIPDGTNGSTGQVVVGLYGTLTIGANGEYVYKVDTLNLDVLALRPGETLLEVFTYQVTDNGALVDLAQLEIVVRGRNNAPLGAPDLGHAVEAGGLNDGDAGVNPSGNVLINDIDIDDDPMTITGIRTGGLLGSGTAGAVGSVLRGSYGDLLINADGSWTYVVDNTLAAVQALRQSGQVLHDAFTYTVADRFGDTNVSELLVTIDGRNDTPIAQDDEGRAVEAGGVNNTTPGSNATGNVLDNDNDVDGVPNGETEQVSSFQNGAGVQAAAGSTLAGRFGDLTLNADGSYSYVVDNDNPIVQALRTAGETITEAFAYVMRDTAGAISRANLVIVIRGADDNPVALDDSNVASDQVASPQANGNVLPNDSDVDGGDARQVTAIRTGAEGASGTTGSLGQSLAGRYGTLVINADGSYTYAIDMSNPEVLAAAGFGQILQDVFTYTMADRAGATDQAQLVISIDISAPRIDPTPGPHGRIGEDLPRRTFDLGFEPGIFVRPVVREDALRQAVERTASDGSQVDMGMDRTLLGLPPSLADGLGLVQGQFVGESVRESALAAQLDLARFLGRHGRVSLSADGLLSDPSVFSLTDGGLTEGPAQQAAAQRVEGEGQAAEPRTAAAFSDQLKLAAARLGALAP